MPYPRLMRMVLAVLMLLPLTPLSAQVTPPDITAAITARNAGDYPTAIAGLEAADRAYPGDPTILRLLGTTYAFAGRHAEAITVLERAQALAPRDQDIALALARTYLWSGRLADASQTAAAIAASDPGNAELPALTQSIDRARAGEPAATRRPQVAISQGASHVDVGGRRQSWFETTAALSVPISTRAALSGEVNLESRSGVIDTRFQLRFDRRIGQASSAYLAVAGTPNANFRESRGVRAGGETRVAGPLTLSLDLRYANYGQTTIWVVEPGVRLHTRDERFSLGVRSINFWGELRRHQIGWALRAEAQPVGPVRFYAGGATYPDTEAGITRRLRSGFFSVAVPIGNRLGLRVTYEHENRASSYTRNSAVLGISWRL